MTSSLVENEGFLHSRVGIPALRLLSRHTVATMYPRQIDFTGYFFPPESLGTNVSRILMFLCTFGILPTQRIVPVSNAIFQVFKVLLLYQVQRIRADRRKTTGKLCFRAIYSSISGTRNIIQCLELSLYKAFDKSNSGCYTLSKIHPVSKTEGLLLEES